MTATPPLKSSQLLPADVLATEWNESPRWHGITRPYSTAQVLSLRPSVHIEYSLARRGAEKLWNDLKEKPYVASLGALTGNQAVQQVQAGLDAIYLSGWQVAADANTSGQMYPDQSLYPVDSVPRVIQRINQALMRADQIQRLESAEPLIDYFVPIMADAEAGFGGNLNAFELMRMMIEAGAAGVHFEDQLSSAKKCGHLGGKVLVPTQEAIQKLVAARLASDVMGVPTLIVARTDADAANLLTSDVDTRDLPFCTGQRSPEGYYYVRAGLEQAIARGLSYAPYADLVWMETSHPDLFEAKDFAEAIHGRYPGKLSRNEMLHFRESLAELGYRFQFITLAGFHSLNTAMFELARAYRQEGMAGYAQLQEREFALQSHGFRAVKHQRFVGTGYFDAVQETITSGNTSTTALADSTETAQFI
jgi:isocitrate lyase